MSTERTAGQETPARAAHDPDTPEALIAFMSTGWLERPAVAAAHPQLERLRERRRALSAAYRGVHLIIPAGVEHVRANDTFFRFRPSSDFAYLMASGEPGGVLVFEPAGPEHRTLLFTHPHNRGTKEFFTDRVAGELWVGPHRGIEESRTYYGVDKCRPLDTLVPYLEELRAARHPLRVLRGHNHNVDAAFEPHDEDQELAERLSEMRLVKDEYEIAELRKACAITKCGFADAIRAMHRARSEREIEAAFWSRARIEANDTGYLTIAAGGHHACTLHWNRNDGPLERGALLLLDAGVECDSL
jgi:Xaa-Pro aminopeptidase